VGKCILFVVVCYRHLSKLVDIRLLCFVVIITIIPTCPVFFVCLVLKVGKVVVVLFSWVVVRAPPHAGFPIALCILSLLSIAVQEWIIPTRDAYERITVSRPLSTFLVKSRDMQVKRK